jgi:hypothetical protein
MLLAGALCACDGQGPTQSGPPADFHYAGSWSVKVEAALDCWPAFELAMDIAPGSLTSTGAGTFTVLDAAGWHVPGVGGDEGLSGTLNENAGTFSLSFWKNHNSATAGRFAGTVEGANSLSGTFTDPDNVFRSSPGTHPCSAHASATR